MKGTVKTVKVLALVFMSVALLACNNTSQEANVQTSLVEQIQQRGVLRVGMSTFVPWAMKDKTGKLSGF